MKLFILGTNVQFFLNRWNHIFLKINAKILRDNLEECRIPHGSSVSHAGAVLLNPARPCRLTWDPADPGVGPVRVCQKTGQCNDPFKPSGSTRDLGDPGENQCFFFQMWDLKPIGIYTLCFQEKNYVFSMWDKKLFGLINTSS
jgi:hypothetical protein